MEDRFVKYSKLYFLIFLLFLSVPVLIALTLGLFYGFAKLISSRPTNIIYELVIISLPAAIFTTVYYIFFKRTKKHPSAAVRIISKTIFIGGFCCCVLALAADYKKFFDKSIFDFDGYWSFSLLFLAGNIAVFFIIAIIQAFTTSKEEDWLAKRKRIGKDL
jgi:hypothetical protein